MMVFEKRGDRAFYHALHRTNGQKSRLTRQISRGTSESESLKLCDGNQKQPFKLGAFSKLFIIEQTTYIHGN
ncbi:CLUMA_CG017468, isoform A [Clunio marinus]|uniref:CLUMA_CG017468, isoform A n=1 Tax=Clunio marinus TaxID=568069 RepID=A0A1J1IW91_9DIPT|nr:CLUMA_CG017468, isoform A [Clunio marinus]